jgi:glycosyltransferase involved in cell wall biosynthesis
VTDVQLVLSDSATPPASDEGLLAWLQALARVPAERHLVVTGGHDVSAAAREEAAAVGIEVVAGPAAQAVTLHGRVDDLPSPRALAVLAAATSADHPLAVVPAWPGDDSVRCGAVHPAAPDDVRRADSLDAALSAAGAASAEVRHVPGSLVVPGVAAVPDPPRSGPQPPYGHPAALPGTLLHRLLTQAGLDHPAPADDTARPLLTVITRTQGTRLLCFEEALTCLAAQTVRDIELIIAAHRVAPDDLAAVRASIATLPVWLQERTTVVEVERPGRSAPLNDALDVARGRYVAVLDDDDLVTPAWVETFAELERSAPGTVLRAATLRQDVVRTDVAVSGRTEVVASPVGAAHPGWPADFSMIDHLVDNATPVMALALPRGVVVDLGMRFDEDLDTTEDWDLLLRAAGVAGVTSSSDPTSIYRIWTADEGSRNAHEADTWRRGHERVRRRLADRVVLLDGAEAQRLVDARAELAAEVAEKHRIAALNEQAAADLVTVNEAVVALRRQLADANAALGDLRARRIGRPADEGRSSAPGQPPPAGDDAGRTRPGRWKFRRQR